MIKVHAEHGSFDIDATAEDVDQSGGNLVVKRDGKPIAKFRDWLSWHETAESEKP